MLLAPGPLLAWPGCPPTWRPGPVTYLATAAGLLRCSSTALYAFSNAVGRPRAPMAISAVVTSVHLPLAWALTNGAAGLPAD